MNDKNPTWKCPICTKPCLPNQLYIDNYISILLSEAKKENEKNESIQIFKDGKIKYVLPVAKKVEEIMIIDDSDEDDSNQITDKNIEDWLKIFLDHKLEPEEEQYQFFSKELNYSLNTLKEKSKTFIEKNKCF